MTVNYKKNFFTSADGKLIDLHEYHPKKEIKSSVVLVYEIFGKTNHIHNLATKIAENNILVYVPDIFSRLEKNVFLAYNKVGFQKGIKLKEKLNWDLPVMDIVSCASLLKQKYPVSIMGFCYGGTLSWISTQKSFIFEKSVCYYGSSIPDFLFKNVNCPTMLHFGENDEGIPKGAIEKVKSYIKEQEIPVNLFEYKNADHGFNCEERKSYNEEASKLAYERTIGFLMED